MCVLHVSSPLIKACLSLLLCLLCLTFPLLLLAALENFLPLNSLTDRKNELHQGL